MLNIFGLFVISAACFIVSAQLLAKDGCVRPCPFIYLPVCASNGRTFGVTNICDPLELCPLLLEPVCGTDKTTYSNDCYFRKAVCKNPDLKMAYKGNCRKTEAEQNTYDELMFGGGFGVGFGGR